jgi:hypothetical protein
MQSRIVCRSPPPLLRFVLVDELAAVLAYIDAVGRAVFAHKKAVAFEIARSDESALQADIRTSEASVYVSHSHMGRRHSATHDCPVVLHAHESAPLRVLVPRAQLRVALAHVVDALAPLHSVGPRVLVRRLARAGAGRARLAAPAEALRAVHRAPASRVAPCPIAPARAELLRTRILQAREGRAGAAGMVARHPSSVHQTDRDTHQRGAQQRASARITMSAVKTYGSVVRGKRPSSSACVYSSFSSGARTL